MRLLEPSSYKELLPLLRNYGGQQTVVDACLAGRNPCEVWEHEKSPEQGLLLLSKYGFAFGWGDIESLIQKAANSRQKDIIFIPSKYQTPTFGELFDRWEFKDHQGIQFVEKLLGKVPKEFSWVELNSKNASQSNWKDTILQLFSDFDSFEKSGGGLALSNGSELIAESLVGFLGNNLVEIGTVTHPDYRGKGYSTLVCSALIKRLLENNQQPYWGCNAYNLPSLHVAKKLGFEHSKKYPVSRIKPN